MAAPKKRRIRDVGIVTRPDDSAVAARGVRLARWLDRRGVRVYAEEGLAKDGSVCEPATREKMMRSADLVVVLGGDGSLLGAARLSGRRSVPVIGINHGELGFLTESDDGKLYNTMERILSGRYEVEYRSMVEVTVTRGGREELRSRALNDAVVTRNTVSRPLTLTARVDDEEMATYTGDGLIIATPTGSTAYSLSTGGPVVEPSMSAILVTPISPHTLTSRPVVLPDRSRVSIDIDDKAPDAVLTLDGQERLVLRSGDRIVCTRSPYRAAILSTTDEGFFEVLRKKLHWGARGR
jgi:NAD+ kinase